MAAEKVKPKYIFENPNTPQAVAQEIKKILLEKLLSSNLTSIHTVN